MQLHLPTCDGQSAESECRTYHSSILLHATILVENRENNDWATLRIASSRPKQMVILVVTRQRYAWTPGPCERMKCSQKNNDYKRICNSVGNLWIAYLLGHFAIRVMLCIFAIQVYKTVEFNKRWSAAQKRHCIISTRLHRLHRFHHRGLVPTAPYLSYTLLTSSKLISGACCGWT